MAEGTGGSGGGGGGSGGGGPSPGKRRREDAAADAAGQNGLSALLGVNIKRFLDAEGLHVYVVRHVYVPGPDEPFLPSEVPGTVRLCCSLQAAKASLRTLLGRHILAEGSHACTWKDFYRTPALLEEEEEGSVALWRHMSAEEEADADAAAERLVSGEAGAEGCFHFSWTERWTVDGISLTLDRINDSGMETCVQCDTLYRASHPRAAPRRPSEIGPLTVAQDLAYTAKVAAAATVRAATAAAAQGIQAADEAAGRERRVRDCGTPTTSGWACGTKSVNVWQHDGGEQDYYGFCGHFFCIERQAVV